MAIEVFNRTEIKYRMDERTYHQFHNRLSAVMELDEYSKHTETYSIVNLYYDTDDSQLICASLKKPLYKEKLRVRAYGTPNMDDTVYVEIKKKVNGVVNKRRTAMKLKEVYPFLESGLPPEPKPYMNRQVTREIAYLLARIDLKPALYLSYERRAFVGEDDLRVSFDCDILSRRYDLGLERGIYGKPLLREGERLMEIKAARSIPVWLCGLLSEYKIYPISFSKYGTEYEQSLAAAQRVFVSPRRAERAWAVYDAALAY